MHYKTAPTPPPGPGSSSGELDIVFAIDTIGSMYPYISSVIAASSAVVGVLDAAHADYRIELVDYKDSDFGCTDYDATTDLSFSTDKTAIVAAIAALASKVSGGCGTPEDVYSGVNRALQFPWRTGVTKSVIVMGDAPGHDSEPHSGLTLAGITAAALAVDPAQEYSILVGTDPDAHLFDQALADATGGQTFDATSDPSAAGAAFVTAVQTILTTLVPSTTTLTSDTASAWPTRHRTRCRFRFKRLAHRVLPADSATTWWCGQETRSASVRWRWCGVEYECCPERALW